MAKHKMPDGEEIDEDDLTCFLYIPGRYFLAHWCVRIPNEQSKFGKGGDCTALVWRKEDEPEKWTFQYRWRWYKSQSPWNGEDEKSWVAGHPIGTEETLLHTARQMFGIMASVAGHGNSGEFLIQGDCDRFSELVQTNKPDWLHMQMVITE